MLVVVALVVVGPRQLPSLLRTLGQLIGRLRRVAVDLRAESGIDEILRAEGLDVEIDNFRRLASGALPLDTDPYASLKAAGTSPAPPASIPSNGAEPDRLPTEGTITTGEVSPTPPAEPQTAEANPAHPLNAEATPTGNGGAPFEASARRDTASIPANASGAAPSPKD